LDLVAGIGNCPVHSKLRFLTAVPGPFQLHRNARCHPTVYAAHNSLNLGTVRYRIITAGRDMITVVIGAPHSHHA
jgi:hypothetical protein